MPLLHPVLCEKFCFRNNEYGGCQKKHLTTAILFYNQLEKCFTFVRIYYVKHIYDDTTDSCTIRSTFGSNVVCNRII